MVKKEKVIFIFIALFSFFVNFYFASRGVYPIDTFLHYDSAYKILNGEIPVRDFWIIHGITVDYMQSIFFYFFGVNWISYISHSSAFNSLIGVIFFKFLRSLKINFYYSILICLCFIVLAYPISGVPFIDLHSTFFSFISVMVFYFGIVKKKYNYFIFIPLFFGLGFFSKAVPTAYIAIVFSIIYLIYFLSERKLKPLLFLFYGTGIFLLMIIIFLKIQNIPLDSFIKQLILYPMSIGDQRFSSIFGAINNRIFNYKHIFLLLFYLIFFLIYKKNFLKFSKEQVTLFILFILFSLTLIFHQILTMNQNFIFFLIPVNVSLIIYFNNKINFKSGKIINILLIIFCILITAKYNERYNIKRKFHDLQDVKLEKAINASGLDKSLYPLNWITATYANPNEEFKIINKSIQEIENSKQNILLITNYNFIDSITKKKIFSIVRTYDAVTIPSKENKFKEDFKIYFANQLKKKKINEILIFFPSIENIEKLAEDLSEYLDAYCYRYEKIDSSIAKIKINAC